MRDVARELTKFFILNCIGTEYLDGMQPSADESLEFSSNSRMEHSDISVEIVAFPDFG